MLGRQLGVSITPTGRSCFFVLVFPSFFASPAMYVTWFVGLCTISPIDEVLIACCAFRFQYFGITLHCLIWLRCTMYYLSRVGCDRACIFSSIRISTGTGCARCRRVSSNNTEHTYFCLLYTSPSPRDATLSRMPSSA